MTRYASGVQLRSSKEKTASGGFSCFTVATFGTKHHRCPQISSSILSKTEHFMQNGIAHFKHVHLVGEKQELHIASIHGI